MEKGWTRMPSLKETRKYTFTVEGETEMWYLQWLRDKINSCVESKYKVSIVAKVQQRPIRFAKSQTSFTTPSITHICDVESNEMQHKSKFCDVLDQISEANNLGRDIKYGLVYNNFTFELWMALHKVDCNGSLSHRSQYLTFINRAFAEDFETLDQYKKENNFKRCLSKLELSDVKSAIERSKRIMDNNKSDSGKHPAYYKKFEYYEENPALTIWESIKKILDECGV